MNLKEFKKMNNINLRLLSQYVPIVARVHGEHHPEFHIVHSLFNEMMTILTKEIDYDLHTVFEKLRVVTDNYHVPEDVCETYEAVYRMLKELDASYYS
ncbi:MAG: iron-sulfur cluster repair di-iron protein, ric [Bacilli bacterium]|nr:iron-sulfur cluster repair di-iron protein, ric [Bacilli bacterium]